MATTPLRSSPTVLPALAMVAITSSVSMPSVRLRRTVVASFEMMAAPNPASRVAADVLLTMVFMLCWSWCSLPTWITVTIPLV